MQQRHVAVFVAEPTQLRLAGIDLPGKLVDQAQARIDRRAPRLRQRQPLEERATRGAEQVAHRAGLAMGEQDGMHALLEGGAVADEMQSEAGPLPLTAHLRVGQPHLRDELEPAELGQHPAVDAVGLAGQRCQPPRLQRIGDPHVPAGPLELVVHEAGPVHRLDGRLHRLAEASHPAGQSAKPISIWRCRTRLHRLTGLVEKAVVETLAAEIQSGVQHRRGLPSSRTGRAEHALRGRPSFIAFLTMSFGGNWSQPTAMVFARLSRFRCGRVCHRLRPVATAGLHKGSILSCLRWLHRARCGGSAGVAEPRGRSPELSRAPELRELGEHVVPAGGGLRQLLEHVVSREAFATVPVTVEYALTPLGETLIRMLAAFATGPRRT
jgi:hypothetical protein